MTHAIGGAQASPAMADKAGRAATHGARRAHQDAAPKDDAKSSNDDVALQTRDARTPRSNREAQTGTTEISELSETKARSARKSDGADDSFGATIDDLQSKPEPQDNSKTTVATGDKSALWNSGAAIAHIALARLAGDERHETSTASDTGNTRRRDGLNRDLRTTADSLATNSADMPSEDVTEETLTASLKVNARETHWLFSERKIAEAGAAAANADRGLVGKTAPQDALAAKAQDLLQKASASGETASETAVSQIGAASGAPRRQSSDGQSDNGRSREQTGGGASERRAASIGAAGKTERTAATDSTPQSAGIPGATQQLKSGILDALTGSARGSSPTQTSAFHAMKERPTMTGQALRAIDITLSPPDLGTVKVRLSLRANALDIDAAASKASTAKLLHDERKGLEQSLRDSGYDVSSLKISDASASSTANMNSGANQQDGGQGRAGFLGQQASDHQRRDGAPSDQPQQRSLGERSDRGSNEADNRTTSGIYI